MRVDRMELEMVHLRARRERAEAVYRLVIAPVIRYFTHKRPAAPRHAPLRSRLA